MAMDTFLAEYYGTAQPAQDDTEKTAQVELFAKLAAAEGIDLNKLTDAQVEQLYTATFSKEASDDKDEEKKDGEKDEEEEKKAAAEKFAEADYMGRVMAHSYVQEMRKIAESTGEKTATMGNLHGASQALKVRTLGDKLRGAVHGAGKAVGEAAGKAKGKAQDAALHGMGHLNAHKEKYMVGGAAAAAGGAAGAAAMHKKKKASAIDEVAGRLAIEKAAAAGWDAAEATVRVDVAVRSGAAEENTKVAQAANVDQAIEIRASELLEIAGYPVDWS